VRVLSLNAGSLSLKLALFDLGTSETGLAAGAVERIGLDGGRLWIRDGAEGPLIDGPGDFLDARAAARAAFRSGPSVFRDPRPPVTAWSEGGGG
jgi:hypothetical protein